MVIFWILAGITIFGLVGYLAQVIAVHRTMKTEGSGRAEGHPNADYRAPISIIKPLKGLDDNLFDNLESFCLQDYPQYEILFVLQDYNDPAYKIVRKMKDKYPEKDISIIVEKCHDGLNPKVNNLIPAYKSSKYPFILISDSNVMVDKHYLSEIITHMENPDVGLVTNVIRGIRGRTIGSILENLHLNSFIAGSVCFVDRFLKMPCVIGKSMLMRRNDLDAIGGFKAVKDVLAEDYIIGKKIHERGRKVVLSHYVINNVNEYWGIKRFLNRHTRWGKLRWKIGGVKYLPELFGNAVFMSSLPLVMVDLSRLTVSFAVLVSSIKIAGDLYLGRKLKTGMNPFFYLLSPMKDLIVGIIWFVPILSNTVAWRGNRYLIGKDSALSPMPETGAWLMRYKVLAAIKARLA